MDFSLTSAQQTFYTEKVTRDEPVWNQALYFLFSGQCSNEKITAILNEIIEENDFYRLHFITDENDNIFQSIAEHEQKEFDVFNFENMKELEACTQRIANAPNLLCEGAYKFYIFHLPEGFGVILRIHHMICDSFCIPLFINKLKSKLGLGEKETKIYPYRSHIEEELLYKESKRFQRNIAFWNRNLSQNFSNTLFDVGVSDFDYSCDEKTYSFSSDSVKKVKKICEEENIPFSAFVYAIFAIYVKRVLEIDDFSVGMPVLNRLTEDDMHTLGLFMHVLPLIMHVSDDDTFISVLEKTYDSVVGLLKNQNFTQYDIHNNCTFEKKNKPLFDVTVDFLPKSFLSDCEYDIFYANKITTPLEIHFYEGKDDAFSARVRYRTSFFRESNITDMLRCLEGVLIAFAENPYALISEVSVVPKYILTEEDKQKILYDFNDTAYRYDIPENSTVYSLFETTAKKNRDKICIKTSENSLTFGELLTVSENIDAEIRSITNGKKSVIAVIAERSVEMYSAIYGIIRGGNAYLPIDPDYPKERIEYILKNSEAAVIAAQGNFVHLAGDVPCLDMTSFVNNTAEQNKTVIPCAAHENDTAYVIYTSGSTGNPKGAKISHKSAVNRILWMHDKYPVEENSVILQKTPYTFDVSVWELFWWGMRGGSLAVSKPGEHFLPEKILDEVHNGKVTHLHFVPSVFDVFLNYLEEHKDECFKFNSVKHVFLSGEALTASLIQRFYDLFDSSNVKLHNLYGPTECAVDVTYYDCSPDDIDPVPIGKPIYNTQMYVVDKYMNLLPVGVTGELCIGGVNVGQGYLNNETLTKEKFVDNPFGIGKLYKTGDLAFWREDGNIVYVGRNDFQVKVRGLRIELGEIENAITSVDGIENAVVVVRNDETDRQLICAFYTGEEKDAKEIRHTIGKNLPKYMLPHIFTHMYEMPLTSSGKIDRKALPEVNLENIESDVQYVAPETEEEIALVSAIKSVLGIKTVGISDNFFELGGDSIKSIHIVAELQDNNYELPVSAIMQSDTIADIASQMKPILAQKVYEQGEISGTIEFSPIFKAYLNENPFKPEEFAHSCIISANCTETELRLILDVIVSHHDILRSVVSDNELIIRKSADTPLYNFKTETRFSEEKNIQNATEYLKEEKICFDLKNGPLVDVVFCPTIDSCVFRLAIHHFVIDLVSWEILLEDFNTALDQIQKNKEIELPAKTASFVEWIDALNNHKNKTMSEEECSYWENINSLSDKTIPLFSQDSSELLEESYVFTLDKATTDRLLYESNNAFQTHTNELLLTALGLASQDISCNSVGILVEGHGRPELPTPVSVNRTVGWFTSLYPVIFEKTSGISDAIINTKEAMRHIPYNGIGYLMLSERLCDNISIIFNYFNGNNREESGNISLIEFCADKSVFPGKFNVNCSVTDGILQTELRLSTYTTSTGLTEQLARSFKLRLEEIIDKCTNAERQIKTVSDFSDTTLLQSELDDMEALFDGGFDDE